MARQVIEGRTIGMSLGVGLAVSALAHLLAFSAFTVWLPDQAPTPEHPRYTAKLVEAERPPQLLIPASSYPVPAVRKPRVIVAAESTPIVMIGTGQSESPPEAPLQAFGPLVPIANALPESELLALAPTVAQTRTAKRIELLPSKIAIEYQLNSSLVDGRADYFWHRVDNSYTIDGSVEASGFFATMFVGRIEQSSQGDVVEGGLRPRLFSIKRGAAVTETAEFNWESRKVRQIRSRGEHVQDLEARAQDLLSFIFQFAYEFATPNIKRLSFPITNARKLERYEFRVIGKERLNLPIGSMDTVHIVRVTSDPADAYEAWLAPDFHHLPVKLRFMLGGRVRVEQIAVNLSSTP